MKTRIRLLFLVLVLLTSATPTWSSKLVRPEAGRKMWLHISGKDRLYYRLVAERPFRIQLKGPVVLKCIVRVIPEDSLVNEISYRIVLSKGSKAIKTVETSTTPSNLRWRDSGEIVTHSRKFTLRLGRGTHKIDLRLSSDTVTAAGIRLIARTSSSRSTRSPLYPSGMAGALTIVVNEKLQDYFLSTHHQPVTLDVIGPARLRVISRLVYHPRDKGTKHYGLDILGLDDHARSHSVTTTKSLVAQSEDYAAWNFGRPRTFTVNIPKGQYHLTLRPHAEDAEIALRFSIPKENVTP